VQRSTDVPQREAERTQGLPPAQPPVPTQPAPIPPTP
jgi:hypothetical protein